MEVVGEYFKGDSELAKDSLKDGKIKKSFSGNCVSSLKEVLVVGIMDLAISGDLVLGEASVIGVVE